MSSKFGTFTIKCTIDDGNYSLDLWCIIKERNNYTHVIGTNAYSNVLAELALERLIIVLLQLFHVVGYMKAEDVRTMHLGVEALVLRAITGESLHGVRDVEPTIDGSLHGAKDSGTGGGATQTHVQEATESARSIVQCLHIELLASHVCAAGVQAVETQLLEDTAGDQEAGAVRSGIVGQTNLRWEKLLYYYI